MSLFTKGKMMGKKAIRQELPVDKFKGNRLIINAYFTEGFKTIIVNGIFGRGKIGMTESERIKLRSYNKQGALKPVVSFMKDEIVHDYLGSTPSFFTDVSYGYAGDDTVIIIIDDFDEDLCNAERVKKYSLPLDDE